jgi:hypothetical protein
MLMYVNLRAYFKTHSGIARFPLHFRYISINVQILQTVMTSSEAMLECFIQELILSGGRKEQ